MSLDYVSCFAVVLRGIHGKVGIYGPFCDLVAFAQIKKREKHRWRSVKFSKEACNFTKINTPPWVFFTFFKLYKCYQIAKRITYAKLIIIFTPNLAFFAYSEVIHGSTTFKLQKVNKG